MKNLCRWFLSIGILSACALSTLANAQQFAQPQQFTQQQQPNWNSPTGQTLKVGIVNTKRCLEESKLGKQEQVNFEKMKNQMESILQDKERALEEIESKLNDDDYLDSISEEAVNELKRKRRTIRSEGMQLQNQYIQTLQQTNLKIVQRLTDVISRASAQVAQDTSNGQQFDVIFTDEACTYYAPHLDVSERVIMRMNAISDVEQKDNAPRQR